jgi:hypothetical protein
MMRGRTTQVRVDHLIGKPFVRGGVDVESDGGLDCEGVAATVCREAGIPYRAHGFPYRPRMESTLVADASALPPGTSWVAIGDDLAQAKQLFDVVLSMSSDRGVACEYHIDILVNERGPEFLTATQGRNVFKRRGHLALARRVICVYRLPSHFLSGRTK